MYKIFIKIVIILKIADLEIHKNILLIEICSNGKEWSSQSLEIWPCSGMKKIGTCEGFWKKSQFPDRDLYFFYFFIKVDWLRV